MSKKMMNKEKWTALFEEIEIDNKTMNKWHQKFEEKHPSEHQSFLEWLHIPEEEIKAIRAS